MPAKTVGMTGGEGRKSFQLEENKHAVEARGIHDKGGGYRVYGIPHQCGTSLAKIEE